jgi:hypothetical protein
MDKRLARRVANVMQREMICSEHGALCFIEAGRRDAAKKRKALKAQKRKNDILENKR